MNAQCTGEFGRWEMPRSKRNVESGWATFIRVDAAQVKRSSLSPGRTYSKRSAKLHQLRLDSAAISRRDFEDSVGITAEAMNVAEDFINSLWEGCLNFDLQISHDGEINFLYGDVNEFFHIHIDEEGCLSYYSESGDGEKMGSNMSPASFPQKELLSFIDRRK